MNWIGGSRARAKVRQLLNPMDASQNKRRRTLSQLDLEDADDNVDDMCEDDDLGRSRNEPNVDNEASFTETGLRLITHNPVQRRVVPLLEFIEKKLPGGHLLSLQLNHQMDITRTPTPTLHDRDKQQTTTVSGPTVPSSASSQTITTSLNIHGMHPLLQPGRSTASTVSSQNMPSTVATSAAS